MSRAGKPTLRFAVPAIDVALFAVLDRRLCVLLIPVERPPHFVGMRPGRLCFDCFALPAPRLAG